VGEITEKHLQLRDSKNLDQYEKCISFILLSFLCSFVKSQTLTLKQVLLNQLKTTHNKEEWFAPLNIAIEGLNVDQANWKEKGADHSIAELTTHIIFWNQQQLSKFLNQPEPKFSGNNNETFLQSIRLHGPQQ
jgi:hypothetical protein